MSQLFASGGQSIGSFSFNISPSNEHPVLNSSQSKGLSKFFSIPTIQKHQFFALLCFWTYSHICICYWKNNSFDIRDPRLQSDAFALKYTVYFYDTFPLKEQAVFSFTDCSETPAASPSHWPHARPDFSPARAPERWLPSAPPPVRYGFSLRVRTASHTRNRRVESGGLSQN